MITAVTAYVPIPGHPRSQEVYHALGDKLRAVDIPLMVLEDRLERCWLYNYLHWRKRKFTWSVADNPAKNSVAYHIVQAQKSEWLADAARVNPTAEVLVWIDYGIFHMQSITPNSIRDFMVRAVDEKAIAIPGCWSKDYIYDDQQPCWRFCGGVIVVPQQHVIPFDVAMKREYIRWLDRTNNLSWEVNTMARVEREEPELPIWWYKANHNGFLFTGYKMAEHADERH